MAPQEDDIKVAGMTSDETENLTIVLQATLYQMIDDLEEKRQAEDRARKDLETAEKSRRWRESKIAAVLRFLSVCNADAHDDWFAEVDMEYLK